MPGHRLSLVYSSFAFLSLLPLLTRAEGEYNYGEIASCADFECNKGIANCTVQDQRYAVAGSLPFNSPLDGNLSWTAGVVTTYPNGPSDPTLYPSIVKDYYLGVPPGLDLQQEGLQGWHGCAVFFVDSNATFPIGGKPGTCPDTIGDDCASALQSEPMNFASNSDTAWQSAEDLCSSLESFLNNNSSSLRSKCSSVALGEEWGQVEARPITGLSAPTLPSQEQNATTNCHPIVPAQIENELALTLHTNSTCCGEGLWNETLRGTGASNETTSREFIENQAVPVLSVFVAADPEEQNLTAMSDLVCLEAPVNAKNQESNESGAVGVGLPSSWSLGIFVLSVGTLAYLA